MKIRDIAIDHFRGIGNVYIERLDQHMNLFVGINGAGKSSILDAISLVFSWYVARMLSVKGRGRDIPKDDISKHSPNGCTIELTMNGGEKWKLYRSLRYHKTDKSDLSDLNRQIATFRGLLDGDEKTCLPIFVHYGVNRVIPNKYPRIPRGKNEPSTLQAFINALCGGQLFSDFFNWFRQSEDYENEMYKSQMQFKDRGLEAVRKAMESVFPEYGDMRVSRRPLALLMKKGNESFKISQLSDGEKCYIMLVCDIARRLSIANPVGNPLEGSGIILIDEVDLHLHPLWQQSVITRLVTTFPHCQFFITSHSPLVASDVKGAVFGIKDGKIYPQQTFGKLSADILSSTFDVSAARSLYVQALINGAYQAIKDGDDNGYKNKLQELISILGADDLDGSRLRIEKMRRDNYRKR